MVWSGAPSAGARWIFPRLLSGPLDRLSYTRGHGGPDFMSGCYRSLRARTHETGVINDYPSTVAFGVGSSPLLSPLTALSRPSVGYHLPFLLHFVELRGVVDVDFESMESSDIDLIAGSIAENVANHFAEHRNEAEFVALSAERSRMSDDEFKASLRSCASMSVHLLQNHSIKKSNKDIRERRQKHVDDIWGDKNFAWWCTICEMEPNPFKAVHLIKDWAVNGCPEGEKSFPDSNGLLDDRHVKAILEDMKNYRPLESLKRKAEPMNPPEHVLELGQPSWDTFKKKVLERFPSSMVELEWDELSFEPAYMFNGKTPLISLLFLADWRRTERHYSPGYEQETSESVDGHA